MKSRWFIWVIIIIVILAISGSCDNKSSSSSNKIKYEYDVNDKYYRNNDHNNDGKLSQKEFQDAVGDWMDDHGY